MSKIVLISGSPTPKSRSAAVLAYVGERLQAQGHSFESVAVQDLPPEDLVFGNFQSQALQAIQAKVAAAEGVVISTPVYKATYTGILKALLDLLDQDAFVGKTILPIATGGTIAHLLAIDYGLKPLLTVMGATQILKGIFLLSTQITFVDTEMRLDPEASERLQAGIQAMIKAFPPPSD